MPLPFAPSDRDPLAVLDEQVDRTEREVAPAHDRAREPGDDGATAGRGRDLHAQVPALPRLLDRVGLEPGERAVGDLGLGRDVLAAVAPELADVLVVLARLLDLRLALHRPLPLALRPVEQLAALRPVARRTPPRRGGGPSPARRGTTASRPRTRSPSVRCSSSSSTDVIVRSRNARSCETMTAPPVSSSCRNRSSRSRPAKSRSFVGSSSRNTSKRASTIAARLARAACPPDSAVISRSSDAVREAEVGAHRADPGVEVGRTEREVAVERVGVARRRRPGRWFGEGRGRGVERVLRGGDAGAAREVRPHRLARAAFRFLREVPDGRGRRRERDRARVGRVEAGEDLEQRRLAGAVRRDDADAVQRPDRARHPVEDDARAERLREVTGDEGGERGRGHGGTCGRAADERLGRRPDHDIGSRIARRASIRRREYPAGSARPVHRARARRRRRGGRASGWSTPASPGEAFERARLVDVELVRCDLSGCDFSESAVAAGPARRLPGVVDRAAAGAAARRRVRRLPARRREPPDRAAGATSASTRRCSPAPSSSAAGSRTLRSRAATSPAPTSRTPRARRSTCGAPGSTACAGSASLGGATIGVDQLVGLAPQLAQALGLRRADVDERAPAARPAGPGAAAEPANPFGAATGVRRYNRRAPPRANVVPRRPDPNGADRLKRGRHRSGRSRATPALRPPIRARRVRRRVRRRHEGSQESRASSSRR